MPKARLTNLLVLTAICPEGKTKETFFDTAVTGFVLEVRPNGGKTYGLRYHDQHGRQRQFKIGNAADLSFDKARKEAIRIKSRVVVGENPAQERHVARRILTVQALSVRYLEWVKTYKRSPDIDERYLRLHILPKFGKLHLDQLDQTAILEWMAENVAAGYAQSTVNRWQIILGHMMRMAKRWGLAGAERNPLEGVKQKDPNNKVEHFLNPAETARLKEAVEASPNRLLGPIVALLLNTGCRKRELLDATWDQFDIDRHNWRIPTSKTGKPRNVPLSDDAVAVLLALPRYDKCSYVVPNPKTLKPFHSIYNSWNQARINAKLKSTRIHDLRHSAASNMANAGQSLYVIGKVLGHSQSKTTERYAHLSGETLRKAVNAASQVSGTTWSSTV